MSIRLETERIKNAKASLKTVIDSKLETPIPESATLDQYPTYVEQLAAAGGGNQINEQLSSQVTSVRIAPSLKGTVKLQWKIPDDTLYAGADISWAREGVPTFPINEDNIISVDATENSVTIEGLEEDVLYGFVVMAKNENGTRNTTTTRSNTVLGYVSILEDFIEIDIPSNFNYPAHVRFYKGSATNNILCFSSYSSETRGCYKLNLETKEWELIFDQGYNFKVLKDTSEYMIIISNGVNIGTYYYNVNDGTSTQFSDSTMSYYAGQNGDLLYFGRSDGISHSYTFDINTKEFTKISSTTVLRKFLYETDKYIYIISSVYNIVQVNKTSNAMATVVTGAGSSSYPWRVYQSYSGDIFIISETNTNKYLSVYNGLIYKVDPTTENLIKCTQNSITGELTDTSSGLFLCSDQSYGVLKYNIESNAFENIETSLLPNGTSVLKCTTIHYNDDYFIFDADPTQEIDGVQSTLGQAAVLKYNKVTNSMETVYTFTNSGGAIYSYPTENKLFIVVRDSTTLSANTGTFMEVVVYDKRTQQFGLVYSGVNSKKVIVSTAQLGDNAVLLTTQTSNTPAYLYNNETNNFDIPVSFITSSRNASYQAYALEEDSHLFVITFTSSSLVLGTCYFNNNDEFKRMSATNDYTIHLKRNGMHYFIHYSENTLQYDPETDTTTILGYSGGQKITDNSYIHNSKNLLTVYNENGIITEYDTLEGDYTSVTPSTNGYAYSSASRKVLIAFN